MLEMQAGKGFHNFISQTMRKNSSDLFIKLVQFAQ